MRLDAKITLSASCVALLALIASGCSHVGPGTVPGGHPGPPTPAADKTQTPPPGGAVEPAAGPHTRPQGQPMHSTLG